MLETTRSKSYPSAFVRPSLEELMLSKVDETFHSDSTAFTSKCNRQKSIMCTSSPASGFLLQPPRFQKPTKKPSIRGMGVFLALQNAGRSTSASLDDGCLMGADEGVPSMTLHPADNNSSSSVGNLRPHTHSCMEPSYLPRSSGTSLHPWPRTSGISGFDEPPGHLRDTSNKDGSNSPAHLPPCLPSHEIVHSLAAVLHDLSETNDKILQESVLNDLLLLTQSTSSNDTHAIIEAGLVPHLITLLKSPLSTLSDLAMTILYNLSADASFANSLSSAGALPHIFTVITNMSADCPAYEHAVQAIKRIASFNSIGPEPLIDAPKQAVVQAVESMRNSAFTGCLETAPGLTLPMGDEVVAGAVPSCMRSTDITPGANTPTGNDTPAAITATAVPSCLELLCVLSQVHEQQHVIESAGGIPVLVQLLRSACEKVRDQAVCTLQNLYGNTTLQSAVVDAGVIEPLLSLLSMHRSCNIALPHIVGLLQDISMDDVNEQSIVAAGAVPALILLLQSENTPARVQRHASRLLMNLAFSPENKPLLVTQGALPFLLSQLDSCSLEDDVVLEHLMGTVLNLSLHPENQSCMIAAGMMPLLMSFFSDRWSPAVERYAVEAWMNLHAARAPE